MNINMIHRNTITIRDIYTLRTEQHDYSASQSQRTLDHHGKTVIERLLHRIHIIGETGS